VVSDTGELRRDWSAGVFKIDTPRTQAAGGNLAAHTVELSSVTIRMSGPHVSVAVQSLDGEPVARSSNILVSVASMSVPSKGSQPPFVGEPAGGDVEIRADTGLTATEQAGVRIKSEAGRCLVHFDGTAPIHWVRLRRPTLVSRQATNAGCSLALEAHCGVAPPRHSDGHDSSARLALRSDSGAINRHVWLDATLGAQ
jgi:hypothetical protein